MKTKIKTFLTVVISLCSTSLIAQNLGINGTGATAHPSALLDLSANDKGFLITRSDTLNIVSPAFGLITLNPTDSCLYLFNGTNWMGLGGGGANCSCNCVASSVTATNPVVPLPCGDPTVIVDITSATGEIWMDRNLGASQPASSSTDALAYGDLFQWGRLADGHQCRNPLSATTGVQTASDIPGHANFIIGFMDWRSPSNVNLWQGVNGVNNPCPAGYRIPSLAELDAERSSWLSNDAAGALLSPLALPMAGYRNNNTGTLINVGINGTYWSTGIIGVSANFLTFFSNSNNASIASNFRSDGKSVRCIKN